MIAERENEPSVEPSIARLTRKTLTTGLGALENRAELFMVEVEEEEARLIRLVVFGIGGLFLALLTLMLVTGTIIFLVPEPQRVWVALGFAVLYLGGTIAAILALKAQLKRVPFSESLRQLRKDRELLDVFK
jgi:uncharacterized membrane protein YqjE